jgi:hypothetical protein
MQPQASTSRLPPPPDGDHHGDALGVPRVLSAKAAGKARARPEDEVAKPPQTWEQIVKSGVAGGIAACVAKTSVGELLRPFGPDVIGDVSDR